MAWGYIKIAKYSEAEPGAFVIAKEPGLVMIVLGPLNYTKFFLNLQTQIHSQISSDGCEFLSPQFSKISTMTS
jgi:hypothetical protein